MKNIFANIVLALILILSMSALAISRNTPMMDGLDRTKRPVPKPAPVIHLPDIQKTTLKNGLKVWLVEMHKLPTVAFSLVINAGSDHDPSDKPGLASITADMMTEGTSNRDALKISEDLDEIGARLNANAGTDGAFVSMSVLSKFLDKAIDIFSDVLSNPLYAQDDFKRVKSQRLTALIQQRDRPPVIANNAFSYILYTPQHPYGNNPTGTETSLKAMTREDLSAFYKKYFRPNNATLIVVGDATLNDIVPKLETSLAGWTPGDVAAMTIPDPKPVDKMRVYLIDKPGAAQSEIRIGYPALARSTPDYFAVRVMNQILGGQFSSRINLNLREKHGYTYGARSGFSFQKGVGPFTAQAGVVTDKTDSSVVEFLNEIHAMHDSGMTAEELSYAKKGMIGGFALSFETSGQIAGTLQSLVLYNLPDNYFTTYLQNIDAVSLNDVQRVSKQYLDASHMAVVVVGDLAKIKAGIVALNLGDVILCDSDGKPIEAH
jgi:predicted Zn-dependent peptidase